MSKKQKFKKLTFVKVDDKMPSSMSHFESGFVGIVQHTYSQEYGGSDVDSYSLFQLNEAGNKIINTIAWYEEDQLTFVKKDVHLALALIEVYEEPYDEDEEEGDYEDDEDSDANLEVLWNE